MAQNFDQSVIDAIKSVSSDRHKLVILLGVFGVGKTKILKKIADGTAGVYLKCKFGIVGAVTKIATQCNE